jgi:ABC-type oligopeptide transport system substrate-binding subunit
MNQVRNKLKTLIMLTLCLLLFGCIRDNPILSIEIDASTIPQDVLISELILEDIDLIMTFKNGEIKTISLERGMISSTDLQKLSTAGHHTITVTYQSLTTTFSIRLTSLPIYQLANGLYDLSKLPDEEKAALITAMEGYLMETMYGGIPLYSYAQKVIFSPRVDLRYNHYHHTLGFSLADTTLSQDDSSSLFYPGVYGISDHHTFRQAITYEPPTLHPSLGHDEATNQMLEYLSGTLYQKVYNETDQGYSIIPSLALGEPNAIDGTMIHEQLYATTWTITLKNNLKWSIPEGVSVNDDDITAEDFVWTFKQAIIKGWPLATSGVYSLRNMGLYQLDQYDKGTRSIDEIGITSISNLTLQFRFTTAKSKNELLSYLSQPSYSPVHREMFEDLNLDYGTSLVTTPSAGRFFLEEWVGSDRLVFQANPHHPFYDALSLTGFHVRIIKNLQTIYETFLLGELDMAYVPWDKLNDHPLGEHVILQPSPYVWRLGINSLGTLEARDAYVQKYPELKVTNPYRPEPILMYPSMRQALYYAIDRTQMTGDGSLEFQPEGMLLSSSFFISPFSSMAYRSHEQATFLANQYMKSNFGFDPILATSLFKDAVEQAIEDGYYAQGTSDHNTVITIYLSYQSGTNTRIVAMMQHLEEMVESYLKDDERHVNIDIVLQDIAFPSSSITIQFGSYDLWLGAIRGDQLDLPSYMKTFMDDSFISSPLNLGVDTSSPTIDVTYHHEGQLVYETWSYNALVHALQGPLYIKDGTIQETFESVDDLILALYTREGKGTDYQKIERKDILEAYKAETSLVLAHALKVDQIQGFIVTSGLDDAFLIVTKKDDLYQLYERLPIYQDRNQAITAYCQEIYSFYTFISATPILTDEELMNNAYLSQYYDYQTIHQIASHYGLPITRVKVYATLWASGDQSWSDVFIMFEMDGYFIPIDWL